MLVRCGHSFHPITQRPRAGDPGLRRNGRVQASFLAYTNSKNASARTPLTVSALLPLLLWSRLALWPGRRAIWGCCRPLRWSRRPAWRPVVGRAGSYRLNRRPPSVSWTIVAGSVDRPVWRPVDWRPGSYRLDRGLPISRTIRIGPVDRPVPRRGIRRTASRPAVTRAVDRSRRTVVRRPVAPVAAEARAVGIHHWPGPIPGPAGAIATIPSAPRAMVVINAACSPIPSPATPTPGLADQ
jgi:hypothetical protein